MLKCVALQSTLGRLPLFYLSNIDCWGDFQLLDFILDFVLLFPFVFLIMVFISFVFV